MTKYIPEVKNKMGNSIVIVKDSEKNRVISALLRDRELITISTYSADDSGKVGNIYLGKVKNIVKNINAAFVEIAGKEICYLPLNEKGSPIFADGGDHPIRNGDELIVQIAKDTAKNKASLLTVNFSITGHYSVLVRGKDTIGVSSKIQDESKRSRLKELVKPYMVEGFGFIIRTNAGAAREENIIKEIKKHIKTYKDLITTGIHRTVYSTLLTAPPRYISEIRDGYSFEIDCIKTDDRIIYSEIKEYLSTFPKEEQEKLELYEDDNISLSRLYGIETKLQKALFEKVWLDSGAYLVIQPTEALVSIDVNTGKAIAGKQNTEETFLKVNLEAAEEIAAQMRLRNLSGIIIVDFIDMKEEEHKKQLLAKIREEVAKDPITTRLIDMTPLGLVEITRQRIRKPIYEQ